MWSEAGEFDCRLRSFGRKESKLVLPVFEKGCRQWTALKTGCVKEKKIKCRFMVFVLFGNPKRKDKTWLAKNVFMLTWRGFQHVPWRVFEQIKKFELKDEHFGTWHAELTTYSFLLICNSCPWVSSTRLFVNKNNSEIFIFEYPWKWHPRDIFFSWRTRDPAMTHLGVKSGVRLGAPGLILAPIGARHRLSVEVSN